jgi:hypothetical protein
MADDDAQILEQQPNPADEEEKGALLVEQKEKERLKFERVEPENIYFRKALGDEFKRSKYALPENIRRTRNIAIVLGVFELICVFASVPFFLRRRSKIVICLIILCFLTCILGTWAKLRLSYWGLMVHAGFTIAVVGGLYIYIIIDICINAGKDEQTGGMNESLVLFLMSLPLLFIFCMGIYSLVLVLMVDEELEERRKAGDDERDRGWDGLDYDNHTIEVLQISPEQLKSDKCVACTDAKKDTAFYPCGHKCLCHDCAKIFQR